MTEEKSEMFSTRDIYLASSLISLGFTMINIDVQVEGNNHNPICYFGFEATQELKDTEKLYWQGKLAVEPRLFITNMRGLKSQACNVYKNPNHRF